MSVAKVAKSLLMLLALAASMFVTGAAAESKARIVRLSNVEGSVQMSRGADGAFERAFLNLPIVEGSKLKTGESGRAEVEFEDGTILHLVPKTEVSFPHLSLGDDGQRLSTVELLDGTLYVNARPKKGDALTLKFDGETATVSEPMHFRIDMNATDAILSVFDGSVPIEGPSGKVEVAKKHTATFDLANDDSFALNKGYDEIPDDAWDKKQTEYHDRYTASGGTNVDSPYAYGMSDLSYYGSYFGVPGYGMVWQPYLVGAGWNPYMDGGWAYYPSYGYMWVSAYPWGWMPYYYGNWAFAPGYGWVWQPGGWNSWSGIPRMTNPPVRTPVPRPPARTPGTTTATVMVGRGLTVNPSVPMRHVTVAPESAGIGVPRGTVHNFDRVAKQTEKSARPTVVRAPAPPPSMTAPTTYPTGMGSGSGMGSGMGSTARPSAPPPARMPAPAPHASSGGHSSSPHR
jgi:hypothetical protein